jgi:hypothetical protein
VPLSGDGSDAVATDLPAMALTPVRILLLAAAAVLAFGAWHLAAKPTKEAQTGIATGVTSMVAEGDRARFTVAETNLQTQRGTTGSYVGAPMPDGITLVRADDASYCLQLSGPGAIAHLAGPGGVAIDGPC